MSIPISTQPIPLTLDGDGVIRVANTRVTLDTVIATFLEGATAEEIVQQYPSLELADVYAVISYYLRQRTEVENYLRERQHVSEKVRQEMTLLVSEHVCWRGVQGNKHAPFCCRWEFQQ